MNPCSPRFVYLFVALRILVLPFSNPPASLRVSEGRTMLASVIQSGSRLEVKSRTKFVENVAGFILVRDTPYLKLYLKVTNNL